MRRALSRAGRLEPHFRRVLARILLMAGATMLATSAGAGNISRDGRPPEVWDHEPRHGERVATFQRIYVDDHTCPPGQIKLYVGGSRSLRVRPTRECIAR